MNRASDHCGWLTAWWCWMVAHCPDAQVGLVYLSWIVGSLNIVWLSKKIADSFRIKRTGKKHD